MMNQKSDCNLTRSKILIGLITAIASFAAILLCSALLIHKEVISIDLSPVLSYVGIFFAVMCGTFCGVKDTKALATGLLIGGMFLLLLIAFGQLFYKCSIDPLRLLIAVIVMVVAAFLGVVIKTSAGARYGRKKH